MTSYRGVIAILSARRFLPSLPLLAAFDAAARTGSITRAADELSLTQSAVSRQIKALEGQLGVELFVREKQKIRLTLGGMVYAREIRDALARISNASLNLRANPSGGSLTLGVPPTFGARWLTPRLPRFVARHPEVMLNVLSRPTKFDFSQDIIDAAIYFGPPQWTGARMVALRAEVTVPVCAPQMMERFRFREPHDIRLAPLLHLTTRPDAWECWLRHYGVDDQAVYGMLFDQFTTLFEAAAAGLGIALLPRFMFEDELRKGRIVEALPLALESVEAYHLCWPEDRGTHHPLILFRDWLMEETAADRP
ncbi:LysR substrate-binding domain-containing protein [Paracoccus sp. PS-1]|uniref:LysR substrate-binding domain-containing protein n=1 Tax=unclassified Paracoccus (in: a-proteobacteria) TaxID=2688777 RepID=UPI001E5CB2B0|nr:MULTISPECIES: LysR substrate-binding domain-containing protein [unclassified Paracoccus (in: a-proteobacteria)]MDQ7262039.1 LysR substrate-binding domain-containing protein [Paracoccus sp. PS1]